LKIKFYRFLKSSVIPALISVIIFSAGSILYHNNTFDFVEWMFLDNAFKIRPQKKSNLPIVFIEIDKKSLFSLGEWPWSRDIHGKLVADLSSLNAKSIMFDIFFAGEQNSDTALATFFFIQSCMLAKNVYLSINLDISASPGKKISTEPSFLDRFSYPLKLPCWANVFSGKELPLVEPLYKSAKSAGHISIVEDADGKIRRVPLFIEKNSKFYPQIALRLFIDNYNIEKIDFPKKGYMRLTGRDGSVYLVPVDSKLQYIINWAGPFETTFSHCSYIDVLKAYDNHVNGKPANISIQQTDTVKQVDATKFFKNKICMVGFTSAGLVDQKPVPVDNRYPLVGLHANLFENIAENNHFKEINPDLEYLFIFILSLLIMFIVVTMPSIHAVILSTFIGMILFSGNIWLFSKNSLWIENTYLYFVIISSLIFGILYSMARERKKKKEVEQIFKRYVTRDVVDTMLKNPELLELGGNRKEVTVLFCDIRNFTSLAESLPPEEVINLLNTYFSKMIKSIFKYHGTIDKFIGDCVMAFWNSPTPQPDHAYLAVKTAIEIQKNIMTLNKSRMKNNKITLEAGIGINTGEVVVGNIGLLEKNFQRTEYTVIGDDVNLAARLVDIAKANVILLSKKTFIQLDNKIQAEEHEPIKVKGKRNPIPIYKITISQNNTGQD